MKRYHVLYAGLLATVVATDVAGGSGGTSFFGQSLCGPIMVWVAALFLPAETIQTRLIQAVETEQTRS